MGVSDDPVQRADLIERAQAALSACGVDGLVTDVELLRGRSHISWRVELSGAASAVLRMEPQRGILPPYDLPSEARLLRTLAEVGVPVAEVLGVCHDLGGVDPGRGCIALQWVDGDVLLKQRMDADAARVYCETLRRIHTLDWRAAGLDWLPAPPESGPAMRERTEIADRLRSFGVYDAPHIRRLREALEGRLPDSTSPMLVHGDINFGNFIVRKCGASQGSLCIAAVLDWEQTHLGDPLSDWGRLQAEDLLGNLDLSEGAQEVMQQAVKGYGRSQNDLSYWTLHQLYKHASATGALSVIHDWDIDQIAKMYQEPTKKAMSRLTAHTSMPNFVASSSDR